MTGAESMTSFRDNAWKLIDREVVVQKRQINDVAQQCGVNRRWLNQFYLRQIPNPSVNKIECIIRTLGGSIVL